MHKNRAWLFFLSFVGLMTLYFCGSAAMALVDYYYETNTVVPVSMNWSYRKVSNDVYAPFVTYTFQVNGNAFQGESLLSEPLFRNEWVADEILNELKTHPHKVWYDPAHPQRSTVEKSFPVRDLISAVLLIGLFGYFVGLGIYVGNRFTNGM